MTIIEYAEKMGVLKYLNNSMVDILAQAGEAIKKGEDFQIVSCGRNPGKKLLATIFLMYEGYLEGYNDGEKNALEACLNIVIDEDSGCGDEWIIRERIAEMLKEKKNAIS